MELKTWERRYRDDSGLLMRRRHVELTAGTRRLRLGLPVLDARERERLFGRRMTAAEIAETRAERRRRLRERFSRIRRWRPWDGS